MVNKQEKINIIQILLGVIILLLIPVVSWIIEFFFRDLTISFASISIIHKTNKIFWVIDFIPVLLGSISLYLVYKFRAKVITYKKNIESRDENINKIASFAKKNWRR